MRNIIKDLFCLSAIITWVLIFLFGIVWLFSIDAPRVYNCLVFMAKISTVLLGLLILIPLKK